MYTKIPKNNSRLQVLDSFRVIAILMVMLYHYYSRYFLNEYIMYEHIDKSFFKYGYLGVNFFFIISGFVIMLTLERCNNLTEFIKKRWLRLWPGMLLCSVCTFIFIKIFDNNYHFIGGHDFQNLLFSQTFFSPDLINQIFQSNFSYIDGAYWSLWVEVCFYLIVGLLYFLNRNNLYKNFGILSFFLLTCHYLLISSKGENLLSPTIGKAVYESLRTIIMVFNISEYILWFFIGMTLQKLFKKKNIKNLLYFTLLLFLQSLLLGYQWQTSVFCFLIYILFIIFIYKPKLFWFLEVPFLSKLGVASYAVYLIHENIGVLMIINLSKYFGEYNWCIGIIMIILFFYFGFLCYNYFEIPVSRQLKKMLIRNKSEINIYNKM